MYSLITLFFLFVIPRVCLGHACNGTCWFICLSFEKIIIVALPFMWYFERFMVINKKKNLIMYSLSLTMIH